MKVKFHLFAVGMSCMKCRHLSSMLATRDKNGDMTKIPYCFIVSSTDVSPNYSCSFYQIKLKTKPNETKDKTILPTKSDDEGSSKENNRNTSGGKV